MRDEKRVVTLNDYEQRLMVRGLTDFRNDALRDGKPPRIWTALSSK